MKPATAFPNAEPFPPAAIHPPRIHQPRVEGLRQQVVDRRPQVVAADNAVDFFSVSENLVAVPARPSRHLVERGETGCVTEGAFFTLHIENRPVVAAPENVQCTRGQLGGGQCDGKPISLESCRRRDQTIMLRYSTVRIGRCRIIAARSDTVEKHIQIIFINDLVMQITARQLEKQLDGVGVLGHRSPTEIARDA